MAEDQRRLLTCRECGREFFGWPSRKLCQDCAAGRQQDNSPERELFDEKDGWRNMLRDSTGTVIVPGGNVMVCLDDLCAYEEACEAAGIHGPEELARLLANVAFFIPEKERRRWCKELCGGQEAPKASKRADVGQANEKRQRDEQGRIVYTSRFCGSCGHFRPDSENKNGSAGTCLKHPRKVRAGGGKRGKLIEVPGEYRKCFGAREACKDWTRRIETPDQPSASAALTPSALGCQLQEQSSGNGKEIHNSPPDCCAQGEGAGRAPEWVGPSAELLPEETQAAGRKEKTADKQCLSLQSESGGNG